MFEVSNVRRVVEDSAAVPLSNMEGSLVMRACASNSSLMLRLVSKIRRCLARSVRSLPDEKEKDLSRRCA